MMTTQKVDRVRVPWYLTVMVLLLYEGISEVLAAPFSLSGPASQSLSTPQNSDNHKLLSMPIWARKAGGNWKPELVQGMIRDSSVVGGPDYNLGESENLQRGLDDMHSLEVKKRADDEDISAIVNHNLHHVKSDEAKGSVEGESKQERDDEYHYDYEELQPEEQECPEDKFWHIRGLKCVPYDCPGGNTWRDRDTGDCILKYYGYRNRWRSRPWRPYRRTNFGGGRGLRVLLFG